MSYLEPVNPDAKEVPAGFLGALKGSWSKESCWKQVQHLYDREKNPSFGNCLVSTLALWAETGFQGTIVPILAKNPDTGNADWHFAIEFDNPKGGKVEVDLTRQQFIEGTTIDKLEPGGPKSKYNELILGSFFDADENESLRERLQILLNNMSKNRYTVGGKANPLSADEIVDELEDKFHDLVGRKYTSGKKAGLGARQSDLSMPFDETYKTGEYVHDKCFNGPNTYTDPRYNTEKTTVALTLGAIAKVMKEKKWVFHKPEIHCVEAGIGNGSTTERFVDTIHKETNSAIMLHASDVQQQSLDVAKDRLSKTPGVEVAEMFQADVFSGEKPLANQPCDLGICSYVVYHAPTGITNGDAAKLNDKPTSDAVQSKIDKAVKSMVDTLNDEGVLLLFHETSDSQLSGKMGNRGSGLTDAAERIKQAAINNKYVIKEIHMTPKLYFPVLPKATIDKFKKVANWKDFAPDSREAHWLRLFLFGSISRPQEIDGKTLSGAKALEKRGLLADKIEETWKMLDENHGYIKICADVQGIVKDPNQALKLEAVFAEVQAQMPKIEAQAHAHMLRQRSKQLQQTG